MANSVDFRADQIQVNKIIVTGSNVNSTNCLLIYGSGAMGSPLNEGNINSAIFISSSVGKDTFFYVSGTIGAKGTTNPGTSVFGGDLHVSGNLTVNGNSPGGATTLYASDGTATYSTGNASIVGSGASSKFTLSGSANSSFGYTTSDTTGPKIIWTMPTNARKITLYSRIISTDGWTSSPNNRYFEYALKYSGDASTPSTVLFGFGINGSGVVYIGDKRTGSNQSVGPYYTASGLFELTVADTWVRVVWDLEQQVMTYGFGLGASTSKPETWKTASTSYIYSTNTTGAWPISNTAQIVAAIQSFDNTTNPGFLLAMCPEIIVE